MATRLGRDEIERFQRDGFVSPIRALDPHEAAQCLARLEDMESSRAGRLPPSLNAKPHLLVPWLWDLVHDPRVVDPVADILGPDVMCWGSSFISKSTHDDRYVAWHQDATYWGLSAPRAVTAWIALTPSFAENGCVRALPGTHRQVFAHTDSGDRANLLGRGERMVEDVDADSAVDLTLAPGEMSVHDCMVVHGSARNVSDVRRVGFAIRYIPASVGQKSGSRTFATLVRGRDFGLYELEQRPQSAFHPDAKQRHTEAVRRGMRVIFDGAPARLRPTAANGG